MYSIGEAQLSHAGAWRCSERTSDGYAGQGIGNARPGLVVQWHSKDNDARISVSKRSRMMQNNSMVWHVNATALRRGAQLRRAAAWSGSAVRWRSYVSHSMGSASRRNGVALLPNARAQLSSARQRHVIAQPRSASQHQRRTKGKLMNIQMDKRAYRLTGTSPILGSQPADPDIRRRFLMEKARELGIDVSESENDDLPENIEQKGLTVFLRDKNYLNTLYIRGYVVKGMLKEALTVLKAQAGLTAPRVKVDNLLFVAENKLRLLRHDVLIVEPDSINERPLRAETMQGPRTALAASEQVDEPWTLIFTLYLLAGEKTAKSAALSWEHIEAALDYGALKGLGQWRNAGHGTFTWERIEDFSDG
jgi:hypothetical protein